MTRPDPLLSAVLTTTDRFATLRGVVRSLGAQTVRDRIELVLVAPAADNLADATAEDLDGFAGVTTVYVPGVTDPDAAAASGVRAAAAPVVALLEDHAFPEPDWCERIIEAHRGPWAAVGPAVLNANPGSLLSWTNMMLSYGRWPATRTPGETDDVARHNSAFKRDVLLSYGAELEALLGRSGGLLPALRRDGHRFYLEPRARIHHFNPSTLAATLELRVKAGRLYAAKRVEQGRWSATRRAVYVAGAPLIPPLRLVAQRRALFAGARARDLPVRLPAAALGLTLDAAGQMVGYLLGPGTAREDLARFEQGRTRHLSARDRRALAA